jgi:hypothetical protein
MLFEDRSLAPYKGEEPYIFLSYSHRNANAAAEVIRYLKAAGFRVWYDEGVIPATQWDENIARAIENCDYLIALISEAYLSSSNCLDELNYARDRNIPMLLIYLEDVSLPSGLAMRLGRLLAIHRYRYDSPAAFYGKVVRSKGIGICGDGRFEEEDAEDEYTDPDAFWLDDDHEYVEPERHSAFRPIFLVLLALVVAFAAFLLLRSWAGERVLGIFGNSDSSYTAALPSPDPTPYETPKTSAEIEMEVTPTPDASQPSPSPSPSPFPTPTPTPLPEPTVTPSPGDMVTIVIPGPSSDVTPGSPPSWESDTAQTEGSAWEAFASPVDGLTSTDTGTVETPSEFSVSEVTPTPTPTPTPTSSV